VSEHNYRNAIYLRALGSLCLEVSDKPWLWPLFLRIIVMVPETIRQLGGSPAGLFPAFSVSGPEGPAHKKLRLS
jgi:hypothetical protein